MAASSSRWLRYVYLALCFVGVLLPYWQFVPWFLQHGLDLPLFFNQLFANRIGGFFGLELSVITEPSRSVIRQSASGFGSAPSLDGAD